MKTEKINNLVTCFCMESFKPSTVRYARRSTQEKRAGDSQTEISTGKDAFNPLTAE